MVSVPFVERHGKIPFVIPYSLSDCREDIEHLLRGTASGEPALKALRSAVRSRKLEPGFDRRHHRGAEESPARTNRHPTLLGTLPNQADTLVTSFISPSWIDDQRGVVRFVEFLVLAHGKALETI